MIEMKVQSVYLDQSGAENPLLATLVTWLTTISHQQRMTAGSDSWEQNKNAQANEESSLDPKINAEEIKSHIFGEKQRKE